jgi:hypothetical protein
VLCSSLYLQICIFYFGISKYLNFTRELWPEVQVQISKTMRKSNKVKLPVYRDLHVHQAMGLQLLTIFLYFTKAKYSCLNRGVLKLDWRLFWASYATEWNIFVLEIRDINFMWPCHAKINKYENKTMHCDKMTVNSTEYYLKRIKYALYGLLIHASLPFETKKFILL